MLIENLLMQFCLSHDFIPCSNVCNKLARNVQEHILNKEEIEVFNTKFFLSSWFENFKLKL